MIKQSDIKQINVDGQDRTYEFAGEIYPSVTSIITQTVPKFALPPWSQKLGIEGTILYFRKEMESLSTLEDMEDGDILNFLNGVKPQQVTSFMQSEGLDMDSQKEAGGERGQMVHDFIKCMIRGDDLPAIPPSVQPYIDSFEKWCEDYDPDFHDTELMVVSPNAKYGGTFDGTATIRRHPPRKRHASLVGKCVLLDYKTNTDGRVYHDQHLPQVEAYGAAFKEMGFSTVVDENIVVGIGKDGYQTTISYYTIDNFLALKRIFDLKEVTRLRNPLARK